MRNRRGQMEMLGLAIVIVIILMGILLAMRFFFLVPQEDPTQAARDVQLGANLLDTMMETTMVCRGVPLVTLVQDCFSGGPIACDEVKDASNTVSIAGGSNCEHAHSVMAYMFNSTLVAWNRGFEFSIEPRRTTADGDELFVFKNIGCAGSYQTITRPRPIGNGQMITLTLRLCQ